jgi:UDP-2-acetamido-3-amino-2,3-dideoxy-glucuronate N-acetyltransferase
MSVPTRVTTYFAHPTALVEAADIGRGTRVWAFCHILPGVTVGRDCNLGDHVFIEGGVQIGDDVVIKNGVSVWAGVTLEDRVFVGPNAAFTNDTVPRAKAFHAEPATTLVKQGASIGANATLVSPLVIGRSALIGAGAVVTRDVPDFGLVVGNPARLIGYVCACGQRLSDREGPSICSCGRGYIRTATGIEEST